MTADLNNTVKIGPQRDLVFAFQPTKSNKANLTQKNNPQDFQALKKIIWEHLWNLASQPNL